MSSSGQVVYGTNLNGVKLEIVDAAGNVRYLKGDRTPKSGTWSLSLTPASELGLGEYYRITADGVAKEGALLENVGWVPFESFDPSDNRVVASGGPGAGGGSGAYVSPAGLDARVPDPAAEPAGQTLTTDGAGGTAWESAGTSLALVIALGG